MKNFLEELKNVFQKLAQFLSKNYLLTEVLFILFLGLIPLLWFKPGEYVLGHDANYPVDAVNWLGSRLTTWSERYNFGSDQSLILGRIPIFIAEALPQFLGTSIYLAQKIIFVFSFFLPGLSIYALSRYLLGPSRKYTFFRIFSSGFYMINHYLLQAWFIAEITKFSMLTALPLVVMFTLKAFDKKGSKLVSILISNLILFIFNGGGAAFTLYGGLFLILIAISLAYLIARKISIFKLLGYWFVFAILFIILNSYWLVPLAFYTSSSFNSAISTFGGIENTVRWTDALSKYTSVGNLIKLQGIPDWYDSPTHPYANTFLTSPFFVAVSYTIPVIALFGFLVFLRKKEMRIHLLWILLAVVLGVIFSAGTHAPFTDFYTFLLKNVPFFSTFRSAFYKFGYSLWFTYSLLIGLAVNYIGRFKLINLSFNSQLFKKFGEIKLGWKILTFGFFLSIIFAYNYPFFTGSFFHWRENYSTKLDIPNYVFEYQKWAKEQPSTTKVMILPALPKENQIDSYNWGYYSLDPLPTLVSDRSIVLNNFEIGEDETKKELINILYDSISRSPETFDQLTKRLGINSLLLRKDVEFNHVGYETDSPEEIADLISKTSFKPTQDWGEWVIYENGKTKDLVEAYPQIAEVQYGQTTDLEIMKSILGEIGDLPYSRFGERPAMEASEKLIFLDSVNVASIDEGKNTVTYELPLDVTSPEVVIKGKDVTQMNYNVSFVRSGTNLTINFSTPEIDINYGDKIQKIESKTFSKTLTVGQAGEIGIIINGETFDVGDKGSVRFSEGKDKLNISVFEKGTKTDALIDLDFENDNIQDKTGSCGGDEADTKGVLTQSSSSSGKFVELSAEKAASCLRLPVETGEGVYKLKFDYIALSGSNPSLCVLQQSDTASTCLPETTVENSINGKWQTYETTFTAGSDIKKFVLHFYAKSDQEKTVVGYDNIHLEKIKNLSSESVSIIDLSTLKNEETRIELTDFTGRVLRVTSILYEEKIENFSDGSFESGLWGGASVCGEENGKKPNVFASFSDDRTNGEHSLELSSQSGTACVRNKVANFDRGNLYKLSFDYKNLKGDAPSFCLLQLDSDKQCFPSEELKKSSKWQTYSTYFIPEKDASGLVLHLYSKLKSSNLFDNVKIESIERPYSFAYLKDFDEDKNSSLIETSVVDSSPSNYKVRINSLEPRYVLSLSQSYNPNWKAYVTNGDESSIESYLNFLFSKEISGKSHITINGIINGWIISEAKPGTEISLEYLPQKIFIASVAISLTTFALVSLIALVGFIQSNYKNLKLRIWKEEGKLKALSKKIESIIVEP